MTTHVHLPLLDQAGAAIGQSIVWNGVAWAPGLNVQMYVDNFYGGATPGSFTTDTAAAQAAIAACPTGGTVKFTGGKTYYLKALGTITKAINIDGGGCSLSVIPYDTGLTSGHPIFCFSGALGTAKSVTGTTQYAGLVTFTTVGDAAGFSVNDYVILNCADVVPFWNGVGSSTVPKIEVSRISAVDTVAGTVTLFSGAAYTMATTVTITKFIPLVRPSVVNFSNITEVNAGSPPSGNYEGPNAPNIVDYQYC